MRNAFVSLVLAAVLGLPIPAAAQDDAAAQAPRKSVTTQKPSEAPRAVTPVQPTPSPASIKNLSNVQIELTISDQTGSGPIEKKTVLMIAASGTWGKVRAQGMTRPNDRDGWQSVTLNVDARPFMFREGVVQVELTISYNPLGNQPSAAPQVRPTELRPTELNQSLTVVLQDGKPLIVSQAADPISDRKIIVEVKATVLK